MVERCGWGCANPGSDGAMAMSLSGVRRSAATASPRQTGPGDYLFGAQLLLTISNWLPSKSVKLAA